MSVILKKIMMNVHDFISSNPNEMNINYGTRDKIIQQNESKSDEAVRRKLWGA